MNAADQEDGDRPVLSNTQEDIEAWANRFQELADEAKGYGYSVVVGITCYDPMADDDWMTWFHVGCHYAVLGMVKTVLRRLLKKGD